MQSDRAKQQFRIVLIKPLHYDDDGSIIPRFHSAMPLNTLAAMYGLSQHRADIYDTDTALTAVDDSNEVNPELLQSMHLICAPIRGRVEDFLQRY